MSGDVVLGTGVPFWVASAICLGAVLLVAVEYARARRAGAASRWLLTGVRSLALLLILYALFRPMRVYSVPEDREGTLVVLVDRSMSMSLPLSRTGGERQQWVREFLYREGGVLERLDETFRLRVYEFAASAGRLWQGEVGEADGERTNLAVALEQAAADMGDAALAGVVVVSDGAHNDRSNALRPAYALGERGIPVHAVAVGTREENRDLSIVRLDAPEEVEEGSLVEVQVEVSSRGYGERDAVVQVHSAERLLVDQTVHLSGDGNRWAKLKFPAGASGIQRYTIEIPPEEDEILATNNQRRLILEVIPRRELMVLFLEGRPRAEFAYIKRAVSQQEELVDADIAINAKVEYRSHMPTSPAGGADLFQYDVVVLGDVSAERLVQGGEAELERYVGDRGGGLLVLGSAALVQRGKKLDLLMPVGPVANGYWTGEGARPVATREGLRHSILGQLDNEVWSGVPRLGGYVRVGRVKPGATALLQTDESGEVLMALQRYGAGKVVFFAPYASWRWRAHTPAEDGNFEYFWQQIVRWLGTEVAKPVVLEMERFSFERGESVELAARLFSEESAGDIRVSAGIRNARGEVERVVLERALGRDDLYEGVWETGEEGDFEVEVRAYGGDQYLGDDKGYFEVRCSVVEFEGHLSDRPLLERICNASGGLLFDQGEAESLPDRIPSVSTSVSREVEVDLWDDPLMYFAILLLFSTEWVWRKRRGMV